LRVISSSLLRTDSTPRGTRFARLDLGLYEVIDSDDFLQITGLKKEFGLSNQSDTFTPK
jgi:hypothetical protein